MGTNYIVSMPSEALTNQSIAWRDLFTANYNTDLADTSLELADHEVIHFQQVLRIVPKKRMVVLGNWQGRQVVAKLFFDNQFAKRHMEQDLAGTQLLRNNKIPTPALYLEGQSSDKRIFVLLYEYLDHTENIAEQWQSKTDSQQVLPLLKEVVLELATQHVLGILQQDLHLNNFLVRDEIIYTLDGAEIKSYPYLLPKKLSMENLALFLAQLGVGVNDVQLALFKCYANARGWLLKPQDHVEMQKLIQQMNDARWRRFQKKIFRTSTQFIKISNWHECGAFDRRYDSKEFTEFLQDPEAVFKDNRAKVLKAGRSATVIQTYFNGKSIVIKRYNLKNLFHRLRRLFRPTRAAHCWRLAQKLALFGVPTATPVAFIEKRILGLRGVSYFVTEYVSDQHVLDFLHEHRQDLSATTKLIEQLVVVLKDLVALNLSHGDLKITNLLVDDKGQPICIDLDGAVEHRSRFGLRRTWDKQIKRFYANFSDYPQVLNQLRAKLNF